MSFDSLLDKLIINNGWQIYDLLNTNFVLPNHFTDDFISSLEHALLTKLLKISIDINSGMNFLHIREEYKIEEYKFVISSYSYNYFITI